MTRLWEFAATQQVEKCFPLREEKFSEFRLESGGVCYAGNFGLAKTPMISLTCLPELWAPRQFTVELHESCNPVACSGAWNSRWLFW